MAHLVYEGTHEYQTDIDTLRWLTGNKFEVGIRLWQMTIVASNSQPQRSQYDSEFCR